MKCMIKLLVMAAIALVPVSAAGIEYEVAYMGSCLWTGVQDVSVEGDYAYCAFANGLVVLDISSPDNPIFVGSVYCQGTCGAVFKSESVVYLATFSGGLVTVDVSDPANPYVMARYDMPGYLQDVYVDGNTAYVSAGDSGVYRRQQGRFDQVGQLGRKEALSRGGLGKLAIEEYLGEQGRDL